MSSMQLVLIPQSARVRAPSQTSTQHLQLWKSHTTDSAHPPGFNQPTHLALICVFTAQATSHGAAGPDPGSLPCSAPLDPGRLTPYSTHTMHHNPWLLYWGLRHFARVWHSRAGAVACVSGDLTRRYPNLQGTVLTSGGPEKTPRDEHG